jgi:serine/threonine-protein kinase
MSPPNFPIRPVPRRPVAFSELESEPDSLEQLLSPTKQLLPSRLDLDDLLAELKAREMPGDKAQGQSPSGPDGEFVDERPTDPDVVAIPGLPVPGDVIGGTYLVQGELGSGAMGVVLLAVDQGLERKVAIKLIQSSLFARHFYDHFLQEARAMAEVNHPHVLVIHAFGEHQGAPYFVTEFVSGTTLERVIGECKHAIDIDLALRMLDEICAGVAAIHAAGIVHRDLKPANILLDAEFSVRVADLGLAQKVVTAKALREIVGTLGYIAPELTLAPAERAPASPQSDVYSLACIAYELLTGQPPFHSGSDDGLIFLHATAKPIRPSFVRGDLPLDLDRILLKALEKQPAERTQSVDALRRELRAARSKSHEPTRILVAEDEEDFRVLLELKLRAEFPDAELECVRDGQAAVAAFDRKPASVVILDLQMPVLDGIEATRLLRSRRASASVPILVLTASGGPNEWRLLSSLGADRLLVKPVDLDDVVSMIRRTLQERARPKR